MYPLRSRTTYTETLDDEMCVYEWTRHEVHALNATAARVWQLCDGKTSVAEIADRLRGEQLVHAEQLVEFALEELQRKHLLDTEHAVINAGPAISRRALLRLGVTAALLPAVTSVVAPTPLQAQSGATGSQTFAFTGASQTFIVPAGVTSLTVSAFGAQGSRVPFLFPGDAPGGLGGSVTATIVVSPSETLVLNVGGWNPMGGNGGGFNGGGPGLAGGGGGGASDVRRGGTGLANRVVVAGGGGGAAVTLSGTQDGGGGAGGGMTGGNGAGVLAALAGTGGTQTGGGAAGTLPNPMSGQPGTPGVLGTGGTGATCCPGAFPAGGGGGGYYGGGGGASWDQGSGGGGGGGSSFADPSATVVTHVQGTRAGAGLIILSW